MAKRVLILSVSAGAGHLRAAEAMERAFHLVDPSLDVENYDMLDFTNQLFRRLYSKAYIDLATKAPEFVGYLYDRLDRRAKNTDVGDGFRVAFDKLNTYRFVNYLKKNPPDAIVCTHFLPAEIISELKGRDKLDLPQVVITTDFEAHRLWVYERVERYFVATAEGKNYLMALGVPDEIISVTGIPIDPRFAEKPDRAQLRRQLGLSGGSPIILVLCGGFGMGPLENLVTQLLKLERPCQVVVVAGRNERLKADLERLPPGERHTLKVLGYTREMHHWMAAADLLVSKPGGLTTSEALACGLPMVIVTPIPGQETRNSDFLLENGAAIKANNLLTLRHKVEDLLTDERRLNRLRASAASLGRPHAARTIAREVLQLCP